MYICNIIDILSLVIMQTNQHTPVASKNCEKAVTCLMKIHINLWPQAYIAQPVP